MGTSRRQQRGFTLIEMMIVVGVIAILAAVVVPGFFREGRKTKGSAEVIPMMSELAMKLAAYKSDSGSYLGGTLGLVAGTGLTCPAAITAGGYDLQSECVDSDWNGLHVTTPMKVVKCRYTITAGVGAASPTYTAPAGFTFAHPTLPTNEWYTILAECDGDGVNSAAKNAFYFMSSVDQTIQKKNEGT